MAEKKKRTLRQKAADASEKKPRRLSRHASKAGKPFRVLGKYLKKLRIPLPENKFGRLVRKIGRILSKAFFFSYFREAWAEIRQVTWPSRKETTRLTLAVLIFSVIFTAIVAVLDAGLDKVFKELIIK